MRLKKYKAAEGGEVPNLEEDDDEKDQGTPSSDATEESSSKDETDSDDSDDSSQSDATPSVEDQKAQAIKDYLSQQYAKAGDNSDVKNAQAQAAHLNYVANIGDALESLAKSNSMAHGGAGVDSNFYGGLKAQGAAGIQQAQTARNANIQDFLQQHEINRQVAQDMMTKGNYDQHQKAAQYANAMNDGTSQVSKIAVEAARKTFPKYSDVIQDGMSANEVANALKGVELKSNLDQASDNKKMQLAYQNSMLKDKKDQKQDQVYTDMSNKLTNPRGNQAVQQAQIGVLSGKKAMDLINQYPDLNKMPAQQVSLLAQELSKVASGGVGSEHGQRSLEANTVQSNWSKLVSNISGEPTGADLKPFIEQNKAYLDNMLKTNMDTIKDYHQQVYNGYKKRLTPEQDTLFRTDHPELFQEQEMGQQNNAGPMKAKSANQIIPAYQHPEADKAASWAKENPQDPRAAEIIKRLGTMNAGL